MTDTSWPRTIREVDANAHALNAQRRALVLAHPDAAKQLCERPLSLTAPDHWNGYLPPRYLPEAANGTSRPNDSPVRAQLLRILHAAAEAADAQGKPA